MYQYLEELFSILNRQDNHIIIMAVFLGLNVLIMLLRILVCTGYRSALFALSLDTREFKSKDDVKKIRYGVLKKIVNDYIKIAEKNVTRIPASAVVERHVLSFSLLGWRYVSIQTFVTSLEGGLVFIGLILTIVFREYAFVYGIITAASFALVRVAAAFFDYTAAQQTLSASLLMFVEREIGQFYAADSGSAILRLKNEWSEAIGRQSAVLKTAIEKLSGDLSASVINSMTAMSDGIQKYGDSLESPLRDWEKAIREAGNLQTQMNTSSERLFNGAQNLMSASDLLAKHLQGHSNALSDQLNSLVTAIDAVKESNAAYALDHEAFLKQAKYIERNQSVLEESLQSYEATLQKVTQTMGDGLGAYVQMHSRSAAQTIQDTLKDSLVKIINSNQDTLSRMTELFDQLRIQSRDVSANLLTLHEKLASLEHGADDYKQRGDTRNE